MEPETWESFVKLRHDATLTMEQVRSECRVNDALLYVVTEYLKVRLLVGHC